MFFDQLEEDITIGSLSKKRNAKFQPDETNLK